MRLKKIVKASLFRGAHWLGLNQLPAHKAGRPAAYFAHRVLSPDDGEPGAEVMRLIPPQAIPESQFRHRLTWLKRFQRFVPMDEFARQIETGRKANVASMSFDDAYADFATRAQPVLAELGIPPLFFITVAPLDQQKLLWFDQVYSTCAGTMVPEVCLTTVTHIPFLFTSAAEKAASAVRICEYLVSQSTARRELIVSELIEKAGAGPFHPQRLYLSRARLKELAAKPDVTIGSHTMTHPNLTVLSDEELDYELVESKRQLEETTGCAVRYLSFPNDKWDERVCIAAGRCGYEMAFATTSGIASRSRAYPRTNIGWWSDAEFFVKTSGVWQR